MYSTNPSLRLRSSLWSHIHRVQSEWNGSRDGVRLHGSWFGQQDILISLWNIHFRLLFTEIVPLPPSSDGGVTFPENYPRCLMFTFWRWEISYSFCMYTSWYRLLKGFNFFLYSKTLTSWLLQVTMSSYLIVYGLWHHFDVYRL